MRSYTDFASVYDALIDQDYDAWADYCEAAFGRFADISVRRVLDLGCGTGSLTGALAGRGYEMTGLDASADMLSLAAQKRGETPILYTCQDMTDFSLPHRADAVVCTMDCVNYLLSPKKVSKMLRRVKEHLSPGGVFLFDVSSEYKLSRVLGDSTFVYDEGDIFYTWENCYRPRSKICTYFLTIFVKNGEDYRRIDEIQKQRAYSKAFLSSEIKASGLLCAGCFGGLDFSPSCSKSERLLFVCKNIC